MVELARPWIPPVALLVVVAAAWGGRRTFPLLAWAEGEARVPWIARARAALPDLMAAGAVLALVLILAGPYRTVALPGTAAEGVAVMVALDVSESMGDLADGGSSKLAVAVEEARRFASRREGDAIGLVAFGRDAVVRVPPTVDRAPFLTALGTLEAGGLGDGTAVGTAVGLAANRLRGVDARSRVILLVTDGRSNAGSLDPVTAARAAAALGQHVYVVEVEDDGQATPLLEGMARAGGGRHFTVSDADGLASAYGEIDRMEPSTFHAPTRTAQVPAVAGLLWLSLAFLVVGRGARGWARLGRLP